MEGDNAAHSVFLARHTYCLFSCHGGHHAFFGFLPRGIMFSVFSRGSLHSLIVSLTAPHTGCFDCIVQHAFSGFFAYSPPFILHFPGIPVLYTFSNFSRIQPTTHFYVVREHYTTHVLHWFLATMVLSLSNSWQFKSVGFGTWVLTTQGPDHPSS
jgi:hypothetical protein